MESGVAESRLHTLAIMLEAFRHLELFFLEFVEVSPSAPFMNGRAAEHHPHHHHLISLLS
jgi:hypothetical protein